MAPKSLAQQLAELEDPTPRDFDPEDLDRGVQSSDEEGGKAVDADAGREHYQAVGKGKLRKQDPVALGKQYAGSKVSRQALEAESEDDPFAARSSDEEDEEDDDEELGSDEDEDDEDISDDEESEEETARPAKGAGKKAKKEASFDDMDTDGSDEMDGFEDEDDDDEGEDDFPSDEDDEDEDEDDDSDASNDEPRRTGKTDDREELRKLMASDQKTIAATISQAAKADAAKGKAVKQQRATFDALLNTRIKLQKGLTAINQLSLAAAQQHSSTTDEKSTPDADAVPEPLDGEAIKSAESAALALWSTLEDLRLALADAHHKQQQEGDDSKKRKRPAPVTPATSSASLWKRMTALEAESLAHRRAVLDKWSQKVRGATAATTANARGKLLSASTASQTISTVLDAQVATETAAGLRAVKRARTATTTTTKDAKSTTTTKEAAEQPDEPVEPLYDDTVFYQTLLRELVEQRMSSSDAITNGLDTLHLQLPSRLSAVHPVTGMRKDKVKRDVDTRASKGRKMKFEIHEKLQNFMAPEDRGAWTRHAREEFFASLLGNTASGMLREEDEDEDVDAAAGEDSDVDREEGGLRLFRN
ncbi:AATF family protein [Aspergillus fijiensis CBS 313.89]|uniref:Protein BFR2 n=1 Tax=Aspergillus fijiensis CBS 313.89 TaxID=1448319 RepID=A0A8G1RFG6_9EURO|nr:TRAUB-domain-containing protein [Aspergillus fijiensis CBS 313.89]RAK71367.1 TRAUB-domain-containing protein [Aspergillus fijiensis CBS 313.89]